MFFVKKKDGGLRMVADCRRANQWFGAPPSTRLFSSGGFVNVDAEGSGDLWFGSFDVTNAFYQHGLPRWLRKYFSLPQFLAREVGVGMLEGATVDGDTKCFPQTWPSSPLGWLWGLAPGAEDPRRHS